MQARHGGWARRLAWLVLLWCGGVGSLAVVALVLRAAMRAAGLAA